MSWAIEEGLALVRALQPMTRDFGYHLTLGGSVLNEGKSEKDIDLFFLPLESERFTNPEGLLKWLQDLWIKKKDIGENYSRAKSEDHVYWTKALLDAGDAFQFRADYVPYHVTKTDPESEVKSKCLHKVQFDRNGQRIDAFIY